MALLLILAEIISYGRDWHIAKEWEGKPHLTWAWCSGSVRIKDGNHAAPAEFV